jgi:hypothetical protein
MVGDAVVPTGHSGDARQQQRAFHLTERQRFVPAPEGEWTGRDLPTEREPA